MPGSLGAGEKGQRATERRQGLTGGPHTGVCFLGACKLLGRAEEKPRVSIDALRRGGGSTVGGQFIVP